jgi:hypothetical protein
MALAITGTVAQLSPIDLLNNNFALVASLKYYKTETHERQPDAKPSFPPRTEKKITGAGKK